MKTNNKFINAIINCFILYCIACGVLMTIDICLAAYHRLDESTYFYITLNPWMIWFYPVATFSIGRNWVISYNIRIKRKPGLFYIGLTTFCFLLGIFCGLLSLDNKLAAFLHRSHTSIGRIQVDTFMQYGMLLLFTSFIWLGVTVFKGGLVEQRIAQDRYGNRNY